jgi:hypothetical protein
LPTRKTNDSPVLLLVQARVEAWLASAPVVEMQKLGESNLADEHGPGWFAAEPSTRMKLPATHTARLVNVQPIVRESEERALLRAALERLELVEFSTSAELIKRISALLARGES